APPFWSCGFHIAAGDVNGDGLADVIVGSGSGGPPFVLALDGGSGAVLRSFIPYIGSFLGGVYVAAADVTGDGIADIVTGAGPGGAPHVQVFDGRTGAAIAGPLGSFFAYTPAFAGGVRVAAGDLNGDGRADIVTGAGPGGGPHVRVFDGATGAELYGLFAFDPAFLGGTFVAAPPTRARMNIDLATASAGQVRIAGWALREGSTDTMTDAIHAWAFPVGGGVPLFAGAATSRGARADVAAIYGGEFLMSGFDFAGTLPPGTYDLVIYARNSRTGLFDQVRVVRVTVP
ncbi:MAG TPA: VCBS repeat-containing protein, partial [Vicinamibacterales bacterium]|nr:VCBS repeat-containing protein [Vicinamibacterales bacterium]